MKYWVLDENQKVIKTFHHKDMAYESDEYINMLSKYPRGYAIMRSYCGCFTEMFLGEYIGLCCRKHDNDVGQAGTYNPIKPHIDFFKCIRAEGIPLGWALGMLLGGVVGSWSRQPLFWYKIYKFRKSQGK